MPELLAWNFYREVVELVRRPTAMLKIHYFSVGHQFFKISPSIKSIYDRGRKLIHLLVREKIISANLPDGETTRAHLTGALGQGVSKLRALQK